MNTKLTLRMDKQLIKLTREYANKTGKSLSRIVSDFFKIIVNEELKQNKKTSTPTVKSLRGILKKTNVDKNDYKKHLEDKYL